MQRRFHHLLINTIRYIRGLRVSPFRYDAVLCAIEDLAYYLETISGEEHLKLSAEVQEFLAIYESDDSYELLIKKMDLLDNYLREVKSIIRIDFIILRQTNWGAVKPLVDAFLTMGCDVRIIPTPMILEIQDHWGQSLRDLIIDDGYVPIDFEDYNIEDELPDIVIDNMAVDCAKIPEFRFLRIASLVEHTVHIEHSILTGYNEAMKRSYFRIGRSRCWQYLVSSPLFEKVFPLIFRIDGNYIAEGCTEMDTVYRSHSKEIMRESQQISVLWNIDALDKHEDIQEDFDRLEKEVDYLEAMASHFPDVLSIVRFHPNFNNQSRCMPLKVKIEKIIESNRNVIDDSNPLIYDSYIKSDAMVTWMSSTTLFSFGATGKPIIVMPTFINGGYDTMLDMHLLNTIPIAYCEEDMIQFFHNIKNDVDKEKRLKTLVEYIGPIDGTASIKIAQEVLKRYDRFFSFK